MPGCKYPLACKTKIVKETTLGLYFTLKVWCFILNNTTFPCSCICSFIEDKQNKASALDKEVMSKAYS